jgi:protein associated with RNAse G/E
MTWVGLDPDFSVQFYRPITGDPPWWKINFERPVQRTPLGIDTFDLLLDLIVDQSGQCSWKDLDEYANARRLGVISDAEHHRVHEARDRAVAFVEARRGPLAPDQVMDWRVPDDWPIPVLPPCAIDLDCR